MSATFAPLQPRLPRWPSLQGEARVTAPRRGARLAWATALASAVAHTAALLLFLAVPTPPPVDGPPVTVELQLEAPPAPASVAAAPSPQAAPPAAPPPAPPAPAPAEVAPPPSPPAAPLSTERPPPTPVEATEPPRPAAELALLRPRLKPDVPPPPQAAPRAASPAAPAPQPGPGPTVSLPATPGPVGEAAAPAAPAGFSIRLGAAASSITPAHMPAPPYPPEARRRGWEGRAVLRVTYGPDGRPTDVQVLESTGYNALDRWAVENIMRVWRAEMVNGRPVAQVVERAIRFRLTDIE